MPMNASSMLCGYCHGNVLSLSGMKSKEEWKILTSDGGLKLQEIHKYNLAVLAYLESPDYKPKKLYEYVEFHADKRSKRRLNHIIESCTYCHDSKMSLSSLWSKKQWDALALSLKPLKAVHKNELKVLSELDSQRFKLTLSQFIKSMRFHASDKISKRKSIYTNNSYNPMELKTFTFKNKNIEFIYEKVEGKEAEAKKIYLTMQNLITPCKLENPIKFTLKHNGWRFNGRDAFFWILTFSLSDIRTTLNLTLEANYQGKTYSISDSLTHRKANKSMIILVEKLTTQMIEEIGLECGGK
jgi:hypothetical protein